LQPRVWSLLHQYQLAGLHDTSKNRGLHITKSFDVQH
jgi:hypothetical protein